MKKQILALGKELTKKQQKSINGGSFSEIDEIGDDNGSGGELYCYCGSGGVYQTGHCKWCGWFCGASSILDCKSK